VDVDFFDPGSKLDAAAQATLEGAHDAMAHDVHEGVGGGGDAHDTGVGDGDVDHAHDHDQDDGGLRNVSGLLALLGARGVPVTVTLSLLVMFGWLVSGVGMTLARPFAASGILHALVGTGVGALALIVSGFLTRASMRPMRHVYRTVAPVRKQSVIGMLCRITTTRVDERFGQGEVEDGGAGIIVQVRCREANQLKRGSHALIFDQDEERDVFYVMPQEEKPY